MGRHAQTTDVRQQDAAGTGTIDLRPASHSAIGRTDVICALFQDQLRIGPKELCVLCLGCTVACRYQSDFIVYLAQSTLNPQMFCKKGVRSNSSGAAGTRACAVYRLHMLL